MDAVLVVAMWLFAVTHVDTFIVLVAFCATDEYRDAEVLIGHYVGFVVGLVAAVFGAVLAAELLREWSFLLGSLPLVLGVWGFLDGGGERSPSLVEASTRRERVGIVATAGVGLSGENVAVWVPFFVGLDGTELGAVIALFVVAAGVLFVVSKAVALRAEAVRLPGWVESRLVPTILVVVGTYVLLTGWFLSA